MQTQKPPVFVALGDSIGFGLSAFPDPGNRDLATLHGYNDQFAEYLGIYGSNTYANLAWPGDKTSDLLAILHSERFKNKVIAADIITASIGGNNLLAPSTKAIFSLWGINPDDYKDDPYGRDMLIGLTTALSAGLQTAPAVAGNPADQFVRLADLHDPAAIACRIGLIRGIYDFRRDWPKIISHIRKLNSHAAIYVTTIHNPMHDIDAGDPFLPVFLIFEAMINALNRIITRHAANYHYQVADINQIFKDTPGALTFDIAGAIEIATAMSLLDSDHPDLADCSCRFLQKADPHPSLIGHRAAFELLKNIHGHSVQETA